MSGEVTFLTGVGSLFVVLPFSMSAYASFVTNTASIPQLQGQAGSARVTHDAGYGQLAGKAVVLDPATGFVFESPLVPRPR